MAEGLINTKMLMTIELPKPLCEIITDIVCNYYQLSRQELLYSNSRVQEYVEKRWVLYYLLKTQAHFQIVDIATFTKSHHYTVRQGIEKIECTLTLYKGRYSQDLKLLDKAIQEIIQPIEAYLATIRQ